MFRRLTRAALRGGEQAGLKGRLAARLLRCIAVQRRFWLLLICLSFVFTLLLHRCSFGSMSIVDGDALRSFTLWGSKPLQQYVERAQHNHLWGSLLHSHLLHESTAPSSSSVASLLASYSFQHADGAQPSWPRLSGLRICLAVAEFAGWSKNGGIGTAYFELGRQLASWGANVTVLFLHERKVVQLNESQWMDWKHRYESMGLTMLLLLDDDVPAWPSWLGKKSYRALQFFQHLPEPERFDLIHWHDNVGYGYYPLLAKHQGWALQNTINVVTLHGPNSWARLLNKALPSSAEEVEESFFEQMTCELADVIIAPSAYILEYLRVRGWRLDQPAYIIPNLIAGDDSTRVAPIGGESFDGMIEIVFYGRLEVRKGVDVFIGALKAVSQNDTTIGAHIRVRFIGRAIRDPVRGNMATWITQRWHMAPELAAISMQLHTEMGRDEAVNYLRQPNRLAVIPSLNENSPYTVVECIERGVRFIASRVGGIPELIHADDAPKILFQPTIKSLSAFFITRILLNDATGADYTKRSKGYGLAHIPFARPRIPRENVLFQTLILHAHLQKQARALSERGILSTVSASTASTWLRAVKNSSVLPLVSVCVTHYERPYLLLQVLHGLAQQTYPADRLEVVVVDDGSSLAQTVRALQHHVAPIIAARAGWRLIRTPSNSYLGAARNYAVRFMTGSYFLFLDDDDVPKRHYVEKMVRIALHNGVELLSTFLDQHESTSQPLDMEVSELPGHKVWTFAGPHLPLALLSNCMGSANIFVSRRAFDAVGGFTELVAVGSEDYEFHMAALVRQVPAQVVPDPLNYVRELPHSMKKTMDGFMADFRGLVPILNSPRYTDIAGAILLLKGLMVNSGRATGRRVTISSVTQFTGIQRYNNWCYAFVPAPPSLKFPLWTAIALGADAGAAELRGPEGLPLTALQSLLPYAVFVADQWYDVNSPRPWPYIGEKVAAPYTDELTRVRYLPVRQFTSQSQAHFVLILHYSFDHLCGDGVVLAVQLDSNVLWSSYLGHPIEDNVELPTQLIIGTTLSVVVDSVGNDHCDAVWYTLTFAPTEMVDDGGDDESISEQAKQNMVLRAKQQLSPVVGNWRRDYMMVFTSNASAAQAHVDDLVSDELTSPQHAEAEVLDDGSSTWKFTFVIIPPVAPGNARRAIVAPVLPSVPYDNYPQLSPARLAYDAERWMIKSATLAVALNNSLTSVKLMSYPYISPVSAHPWVDPITREKYAPVLQYTPRSHLANVTIRVVAARSGHCGDGATAHFFIGQHNVHHLTINATTGISSRSLVETVYRTALQPSAPLRLMIDPLDNPDCDDTLINIFITQQLRE